MTAYGTPPPFSVSLLERIAERFEPAPDPYLKSLASVFCSSSKPSIESSTDKIKQALHCGFSSTPTLNHTGELNAAYWFKSKAVNS